jgi:hypothetical protein
MAAARCSRRSSNDDETKMRMAYPPLWHGLAAVCGHLDILSPLRAVEQPGSGNLPILGAGIRHPWFGRAPRPTDSRPSVRVFPAIAVAPLPPQSGGLAIGAARTYGHSSTPKRSSVVRAALRMPSRTAPRSAVPVAHAPIVVGSRLSAAFFAGPSEWWCSIPGRRSSIPRRCAVRRTPCCSAQRQRDYPRTLQIQKQDARPRRGEQYWQSPATLLCLEERLEGIVSGRLHKYPGLQHRRATSDRSRHGELRRRRIVSFTTALW